MKYIAQCTRCNQKIELAEAPADRVKCECGAAVQVYASYTMTPEELSKYQAMPAPNKGEKRPGGVRPATRELESRRKKEKLKEENDMAATKDGPNCGLTRDILIEQVAKGETLSSIERAWGMKYNTIHNWVKKWGLKGLTPEKAQALLDRPMEPVQADPEPELLREKNTAPRPMTGPELLDKAEREIERLTGDVEKLNIERDRLLKDRADWNEREEILLRYIDELEAARTGSAPVTATLEEDMQPARSIECLDAIEAATEGLEGLEAYSTGAAIEYLWSWKRKNGIEDLQKARFYLDRLIAGASGA